MRTSTPLLCLCSLLLVLCGCSVTQKDVSGTYQLDKFPKTILQIKKDSTFRFEQNNPNPYLHPFDHPNESYFVTTGAWKRLGNRIEITSNKDSLTYPLVQVNKGVVSGEESVFTFHDKFGDLVPILYVQYTDNSVRMALHRSMSSFSENLSKRDTLKFHFYGYRPWTFISSDRENATFSVLLHPEYRPGVFNQAEFNVRGRRLVGRDNRAKFRKIDRCM